MTKSVKSEQPMKAFISWLYLCAGMIIAMALIGAITRLTESGLSIMVWEVFRGVFPPLNDQDSQRYCLEYQKTDEFKLDNTNMDLSGFKQIFWWEWIHRFWGRLIGLVFVLPMLWFWVRKQIPAGMAVHLLALLCLGGLQGFIGWFMVHSGFGARTDVSQYRLALHLSVALLLLAYVIILALRTQGFASQSKASKSTRVLALVALVLVAVTIVSGAFVAGLNAGLLYNEFPHMGRGRLVPVEYARLSPYWINWFENHAAVQFNHRLLAAVAATTALVHGFLGMRLSTGTLRTAFIAMCLLAVLQYLLGILTLLTGVNIVLATLHQAGAIALLIAALLCTYGARAAIIVSKKDLI